MGQAKTYWIWDQKVTVDQSTVRLVQRDQAMMRIGLLNFSMMKQRTTRQYLSASWA